MTHFTKMDGHLTKEADLFVPTAKVVPDILSARKQASSKTVRTVDRLQNQTGSNNYKSILCLLKNILVDYVPCYD